MKKINIFKILLVSALLIVMFGIVLPYLFSAKSTILVIAGVVTLFVIIAFGALSINKLIGSVENEEY